ncbi:MAG: ABC transporter permease [Alkalispirochaeta sp.]
MRLMRLGVLVILLVVVLVPGIYEPVARMLFPTESAHIYQRVRLSVLFGQHIVLAGLATVGAAIVGVSVGVLVTRPQGRSLIPLVRDLAALAQTIPPVAVLVLAVPVLGFGTAPTVLALFLFSVLPILGNTVTGLEQVDPALLEASTGMGMRDWRRLLVTELPLASPVILAGVRTAAIISVGTATIGATIGAGGLGVVIIAGLVRDNLAFITAGAAASALLALIVDWFFELAANRVMRVQQGEAAGQG